MPIIRHELQAVIGLKFIAERMGIGIMLTSVFFIRLTYSTKGIGTDMATSTQKQQKRASLIDLEAYNSSILIIRHKVQVSRSSHARHLYMPVMRSALRVMYHTYALCPRHTWAQVFTPAYGRE